MNAELRELVIDSEVLAALDRTAGVNPAVDLRDEMLSYATQETGASRAAFEYLRLGRDLADVVDQIARWAFADAGDVTVLEFAAGYGRIARHLVTRFTPEQITVSDIDAEAVAFAASTFGVTAKVSVATPEDLTWDERFDLIVVPSLFSHLPDATFGRWIATLYRLLTPRGVLVFSVHGDHLRPGIRNDGIEFNPASETGGRLDPDEYGTAFVTEAYVAARIAELPGPFTSARIERGFWDHQDAWIVSGRDQREATTFEFERPILGHVDRIDVNARQATVLGWALSDEPGLTVEVVAGDAVLASAGPDGGFVASPDVAGVRGEGFGQCRYGLSVDLTSVPDLTTLVIRGRDGSRSVCFLAQTVAAVLADRRDELRPSPGSQVRNLLGRLRRRFPPR